MSSACRKCTLFMTPSGLSISWCFMPIETTVLRFSKG